MRRLVQAGLMAMVLLGAAGAQAQTVNPSKFQWEASDHVITARYEVGYFLAGAAAPVQTASIAVAAVTAVDADTFETGVPRPVLGVFVAKMKACGVAAGGGEVCSEWSEASPSFLVSPRAIVGLRHEP